MTPRVCVKTALLALAALTAACSGERGLVQSRTDTSSLLEWQKDPGKLGERWRHKVGGHLNLSGAAVDTERVYVGTDDAVVALDVESGDELWRVDLADVVEAPTVVGERVLVEADQGNRLVALDAATGKEVWTADVHSTGEPTVIASGAPVVTDVDGVVSLDPDDGRQRWRAPRPPIGEPGLTGPVGVDGNLVFLHTDSPTAVVALDAQTGGEVWRQPVRASRQAPRVYAGGGLVVLAEAGGGDDHPAQLVALDAPTGHARWEVTLPAPTLSPPVRLDDVVVFSTGKGVAAVAIDDGTDRFSAIEDAEYPAIASCGEAVCVMYLGLELRDATGRVIQEIDVPEISIVPPASFLNLIIVLDTEGTVYRYR